MADTFPGVSGGGCGSGFSSGTDGAAGLCGRAGRLECDHKTCRCTRAGIRPT